MIRAYAIAWFACTAIACAEDGTDPLVTDLETPDTPRTVSIESGVYGRMWRLDARGDRVPAPMPLELRTGDHIIGHYFPDELGFFELPLGPARFQLCAHDSARGVACTEFDVFHDPVHLDYVSPSGWEPGLP